jgi:hypothetical protein
MIMCLACIDPYSPDMLSIDYGILVIDGYFVPNDTTRITLTRTTTIDAEQSAVEEPPATVRIESDNGFSVVLTPQGGHLYTTPPLPVDTQANYRMTVRTADGRVYESEYVPLHTKTSVDSVAVHEESAGENVSFNVFSHDVANRSGYYSFQYDETWEYSAMDYSLYRWENGVVVPRKSAAELYSCWNTRQSSDIRITSTVPLSADVVFDFPLVEMRQSDRRLYFAYSLFVRQYVLTAEAFSYWTITRKNSEELGGLFDPLPAQPNSNYRCTTDPGRPVVGFFTASEVSTRRLFIKRSDLRGPHELYQPTGYEKCECKILPLEDLSEENLRGHLIVDGLYEEQTSRLLGYKICETYCLDCRLAGGTLRRPDYWQ